MSIITEIEIMSITSLKINYVVTNYFISNIVQVVWSISSTKKRTSQNCVLLKMIKHYYQSKKMTYRTCKPPSQSVYSGVCHRLALTSKIAIGFCSGVRHRLALMSKITFFNDTATTEIYTIILTNMSYKRKRKIYFGFIHYKKHTLSSD